MANELEFFFNTPTQIPPPFFKDDYENIVGRILFSKKPIPIGKEDLNNISNHFEAGDEVYGMVYLPDTLENLGFQNGFKIYIRDIEETGYSWIVEYNSFKFTTRKDGTSDANDEYYDLDVIAEYGNAWDKNIPKQLLQQLVNFLGEQNSGVYRQFRTHKWQIELSANYKLVAKGIFNYTIDKESVGKIIAMNKTYTDALLKDFKLPNTKRDDDELAEKIAKVIKNDGVDVRKVVFSTEDWGLIRHELTGNILCRSIWAYVIYKNEKNEFHYDEIQFIEDYIGDKFSGTIKKAGYGLANGQILEENI